MTQRVNWGRSYTSPNANAESQLARVRLPESRDLTLYLQPMRDPNGVPIVPVNYRVTVGTGGIAVVSAFVPAPVYGAVRHYVADTVEVNVITPGATPPNPRIVAANVALGRPTSIVEPGGRVGTTATLSVPAANMPSLLTSQPDTNSWVTVNPGTNQLFRIPMFATHAQIRTRGNVGPVAGSEMLVWGVGPNGGATINSTLVSDYAQPTPLAPDISLVELQNTNVNPLTHFDVLLSFSLSL